MRPNFYQRILHQVDRRAGTWSLMSLIVGTLIALLWVNDCLGYSHQGTIGLRHMERQYWLILSLTEIHAASGPIVEVRLAGWFVTLCLLGACVLPLRTLRIYSKVQLGNDRIAAGMCPTCGYDMRGTPERCPECGHSSQARPIS